jgi:flagellar motor switch protein FliG
MNDEGIQKSAILLMSLGEDEAAGVLKHLAPREVQKIGAAMAALKGVSREQIESTLGEFCDSAQQQSTIGLGADEYIRNMLKKALGDDRSANLIERILQGGDTSGIEGLK